MNKDNDYDVAIVGLGPVGGVLANLLGTQGLKVAVLDREPGVMQMPRGVGIDGEMMRVVQAIGLSAELEPQLKIFRGAQYLDITGKVVSTRPGITGPGPQGWPNRYNVHQPEFEEVMRSGLTTLPNVKVLTSHEVTGVCQDDAGATVTATNLATGAPLELTASYVVGCDGGRSIVRTVAGFELEDYGLNEPWIVADFQVSEDADLPGINTHYADPQQPVIYIHVVRNLRRFEFKPLPDADLTAAVQPEALWARVSRWLQPEQAELLRATVYTHRSLVARTWRAGRLIVAGDAAHQTPPFLGQGLCTGVRDAASLAWRLHAVLRNGAAEALLDSYESERIEHARFFIQTATSLGSVLTAPDHGKLEALNARIGREGRGASPKLGPGIYMVGEVGGTLAPQPRGADGVLLDDITGYNFAVVATAPVLAQLPAPLRATAERCGLVLVEATGDALQWLRDLDSQAVILRPDRYYYGTFKDAAELEDAVGTVARTVSPVAFHSPGADAPAGAGKGA